MENTSISQQLVLGGLLFVMLFILAIVIVPGNDIKLFNEGYTGTNNSKKCVITEVKELGSTITKTISECEYSNSK